MARLNEPPTLSETLEALKRRFIRQNREIARANSNQSQKIRSLECETSRLLSENITLREENIQLQKALERSQALNESAPGPRLKSQLQSKLDEINSLIAELDKPSKTSEGNPTPGRSVRKSFKRASNPRAWRTSFDRAEIAAAEGRLPPIFENKLHPRKTFSEEETLRDLGNPANSLDSPEPGPPPVAHFDQGDPVKRNAPQSPAQDEPLMEHNAASAFLSSNLETRKRRKDSMHDKDVQATVTDTNEANDPSTSAPEHRPHSLKATAKRKFSATEEDDRKFETRKPLPNSNSQDDLVFQRKQPEAQENRSISRSKSYQSLAGARSTSKDKPPSNASATNPSRKALGEKSVNTDPMVSPAKHRNSLKDKDKHTEKPDDSKKDLLRRQRDPSKPEKPRFRQIRPIEPPAELPATANIDEPELPPVTPAPATDDIFSPSTQPSTVRAEVHDTPPPADNPSSRPARRPRSSVSYAEPNLRAKMRRPTKDMVDAVPMGGAQRRSSSALPEDPRLSRSLSAEPLDASSTALKTEPGEIDLSSSQWRPRSSAITAPGSPLSGKSTAPLPDPAASDVSAAAQRQRRTSALRAAAQVAADLETERRGSASQETIAALLASSSKKLARARDPFGVAAAAAGKGTSVPDLAESLAVFDISDTTPPQPARLARSKEFGVAGKAEGVRRVGRPAAGETKREGLEEEREEDAGERGEGRGGRGRRRETTLGAGSDGDGYMEEGATALGRAERAERRRSMMV